MSRMGRYRFAGGTAVLTGAASGIGERLAHGLARRGSHLVLLDRDAERLDRVRAAIAQENSGITVSTTVVDLADRDATVAAAESILREHQRITLLVNNAGAALGGRFDQVTLDEFEWLMDVNFRAPVVLTHTLLPALTAAPGRHVVNVSSLFGLIAPAGQSAYCASKFALRGLSQVLWAELAESGTGVTTVHPGGIKTRVADSAHIGSGVPTELVEGQKKAFNKLLTYPPEKAAEQILDGVERRRSRVLIAASAKIPDLLARLLPAAHQRVIALATGSGRQRRNATL